MFYYFRIMLGTLLLVALGVLIVILFYRNDCYQFDNVDQKAGEKALKLLHKQLSSGNIENIPSDQLQQMTNNILMIKEPVSNPSKENYDSNPLAYFQQANIRNWPQYYYSFPYNEKYGGSWPPGMYSRLYNWSPGFYSGSGWQIAMRPGIGYKYWPRDRWIRNTQNGSDRYYYVTNLSEWNHNTANYDDLPLYFP